MSSELVLARRPSCDARFVRPASPMTPSRSRPAAERLDPESARWVSDLHDPATREEAIRRLHELLVRAARFEVRRRASRLRGEEVDDVALQSADDALMAVLAKLDTYRGASRFTTWVYKFALLEAAVAMRRRAWQGREVVLRGEDWAPLVAGGASPAAEAETAELLERVSAAIAAELTPHQRAVLLALAVDGVPVDVLAERLSTTRGALYKTLHDARRRLRARLELQGVLDAPARKEERR